MRRRSRRISILRRLFEKSSAGLTTAASCDGRTHTPFIYLFSPVKSAHDYGQVGTHKYQNFGALITLVCLYSVYLSTPFEISNRFARRKCSSLILKWSSSSSGFDILFSRIPQWLSKRKNNHSLTRSLVSNFTNERDGRFVIVAWVLYLSCALEKCVKKSELTFVVEVTAARIFSLQTPVCFRGPLKMVRKVNKYILSLCECACGLNMIFFAWGVGAFCLWFSWKRPIVSVKWQHTTLKRFVWKIVLKKMLIRSCKGLGSFVKMLGYSS